MLAEAAERASLSTARRVLRLHGLEGRFPSKDHYCKRRHEKARRWFTDTVSCALIKTKIELFGHNENRYFWTLKGDAGKAEKAVPNERRGWQRHGEGVVLPQEGLAYFTKEMVS